MNLQDFKKNKPEFVKEASKCKDKFEFTQVAEKHHIKFGANSFEKAFNLFCKPTSGELSEDDLLNVAGGQGENNFEAAEISGVGTIVQ